MILTLLVSLLLFQKSFQTDDFKESCLYLSANTVTCDGKDGAVVRIV